MVWSLSSRTQNDHLTLSAFKGVSNMTQEEFILEYAQVGLPNAEGSAIRLYEDGRVVLIDTKASHLLESHDESNWEILQEISIPPEQVISYAEKLVQGGFYDLESEYQAFILDGWQEWMTLNYKGQSKTVQCGNTRPRCRAYNRVIREINKLVK